MTPGGPAEWDAQAERRFGGGRRDGDQLREHDRDAFAHNELVDRLLRGAAPLREDVERRIRSLETRVFAGTVIGSVGLIVLGVTLGAVLSHLLK